MPLYSFSNSKQQCKVKGFLILIKNYSLRIYIHTHITFIYNASLLGSMCWKIFTLQKKRKEER